MWIKLDKWSFFPEDLCWFCEFLQLKTTIKGWEDKHKALSEQIKGYQKAQKDLEDSVVLKDHNVEVSLWFKYLFFFVIFSLFTSYVTSHEINQLTPHPVGAVWSPGRLRCLWYTERWRQTFSQRWNSTW